MHQNIIYLSSRRHFAVYTEPRKNSIAKKHVMARFVDKPAHTKIAVQIALLLCDLCDKHSFCEKTSFTAFDFWSRLLVDYAQIKVHREVLISATFLLGSILPNIPNPERTAAIRNG